MAESPATTTTMSPSQLECSRLWLRTRPNFALDKLLRKTPHPARTAPASQIPTLDEITHHLCAPAHDVLPTRGRSMSRTGPTPPTPQKQPKSIPKPPTSTNPPDNGNNLLVTAILQRKLATLHRRRVQPEILQVRTRPASKSQSKTKRITPMKWLGTPSSAPQPQALEQRTCSQEPVPYGHIPQSCVVKLQAATIQALINHCLCPTTSPAVPNLAMALVGYTETHALLRGYSALSRAFACTWFAAASLEATLTFTSHRSTIGLSVDEDVLVTALFALYRQRGAVESVVLEYGGTVEEAVLLQPRDGFWRDVERLVRKAERARVRHAAERSEAVWRERQWIAQCRVQEERRARKWEERVRLFEGRRAKGSPLRVGVCVGQVA